MKNKDVEIHIPIVGDMWRVKIVTQIKYMASLRCGFSQGGYFILLHGNGKVVPLSWQLKKLIHVTKNSFASETLALGDGADASYLIGSLIKMIFSLPNVVKIKCMADNTSLFDTHTTANVIKDLWLSVDIAWLLQMEENQEICVKCVEGKNQLADCLTKAGTSSNKLIDVLEQSSLPSLQF